MNFRSALEQLLRARFPVIYIESFEETRVIQEVTSLLSSTDSFRVQRDIAEWSVTEGIRWSNGRSQANSSNISEALGIAHNHPEPAVFIFKDAHAFLGDQMRPADPTVIRRIRDIARDFKESANPKSLILISPVLNLPVDIEKEVTVLDFPLPSEAEIRGALDHIISANSVSGRIVVEINEADKEKFAKAAAGLTLGEAENAFARAMVNDGKLTIEDLEVILEEKRQTIKKSGLLEFVDAEINLNDVGGLDNLKRWLARRDDSWLEEARAYGLPSPKGVLITGVPGCGKSLTAKAIASAWGLPLLRMDIGKVFSGLVGSSEQNMRNSIKTAEAIAPCVLWIDEIEKGFSGTDGSGDSGTTARVFGSFLTWMQEKSQPVFVIATANNIDRLPPEFLRKGRFDEIFFVDLPTKTERKKIWEIQLKRRLKSEMVRGGLEIVDALFTRLSDESEGYSGAEIEQAVIVALFEAFAEKRSVTEADLSRAITTMVPLSVTQVETIARIRGWANERAIAATAPEDRETKKPDKPKPVVEKEEEPQTRGGRQVDF
jgi:SpoVK/Ycf46/Vps4 family AAA+-type ATPase